MHTNTRTHRTILNIVLMSAGLLIAGRANASKSTTYGVAGCIGAASTSFTISGGVLTATADDTEIVCPITKKTSGPNTSGDAITGWTASINNNKNSTGIFCQVAVYSSEIDSPTESNLIFTDGHQSAKSDTKITRTGLTDLDMIDGYWGDDIWGYAELECDLQNGQKLSAYTVTESGTAHGNYIYPGFVCTDIGLEGFNYFTELESGNNSANAFMEAQGGSQTFEAKCPVPGSTAQFTMLPSLNPAGWGFSFSSGGPFPMEPGSGPGAGTEFYSATFPGQLVGPAGEVASNGFLNTSAHHTAYFEQRTFDGDMGIVSVRTTGD